METTGLVTVHFEKRHALALEKVHTFCVNDGQTLLKKRLFGTRCNLAHQFFWHLSILHHLLVIGCAIQKGHTSCILKLTALLPKCLFLYNLKLILCLFIYLFFGVAFIVVGLENSAVEAYILRLAILVAKCARGGTLEAAAIFVEKPMFSTLRLIMLLSESILN